MKIDVYIWTRSPQAPTNQRLWEEAQKQGLNVFIENLAGTPVRPRARSLLFLRSTGLDYLDYDIRLGLLWQQKGLVFPANSLELTQKLRDKTLAHFCLQKLGLPTPPTYKLDDPELLLKLKLAPKGIVVKPRRSNQGKGLFVLDSLASLKTVARAWEDLGDTRFVVQPKLDKKREWRVLGLPDQAPLWILRSPQNPEDIRGNRSFSHESLFNAQKESATRALELCLTKKLKGLNYWGADILETREGDFFVLELNPSPGLSGAEELTQKNLCADLLTSILGTLPNQR